MERLPVGYQMRKSTLKSHVCTGSGTGTGSEHPACYTSQTRSKSRCETRPASLGAASGTSTKSLMLTFTYLPLPDTQFSTNMRVARVNLTTSVIGKVAGTQNSSSSLAEVLTRTTADCVGTAQHSLSSSPSSLLAMRQCPTNTSDFTIFWTSDGHCAFKKSLMIPFPTRGILRKEVLFNSKMPSSFAPRPTLLSSLSPTSVWYVSARQSRKLKLRLLPASLHPQLALDAGDFLAYTRPFDTGSRSGTCFTPYPSPRRW